MTFPFTDYPAAQELVIFLGGWVENTVEANDVLLPTHVQEQGCSYTKLQIHMHAMHLFVLHALVK